MGWWKDDAYEDAERAEYKAWRASASWSEFLFEIWKVWGTFVFGLLTGLALVGWGWMLMR